MDSATRQNRGKLAVNVQYYDCNRIFIKTLDNGRNMITAVEMLNEKQESIPENEEFDDNKQIDADDILREV
ncbi:hypothetical protein FF38_13860 [Lucilia cuprina]|uniref:Uncharacterized protein n=1 Tax=Lucilia cuprina TaxID=7375 RepID=A0A0L0CQA9_LUCCU|nr:hypothetical protein FF38_13860 [Lucilia cuprina]